MGIESDVDYLEGEVDDLSMKLGRIQERMSLLERFGTSDFKYYVALDKALDLVCDAELQLELHRLGRSKYHILHLQAHLDEAVKVLEDHQ